MNQPLDLCITFSPLPPGSPAGSIANIVLHCDSLSMSSAGELLTDPLTEGERADLRWYLEEYWKWPYEQFLERGKRVEMLLPELGKRLYKAVLGSDQAKEIVRQWWIFAAADRQISIVSNNPTILSLPWELLHDEQDFLTLRTPDTVLITRRLLENEQTTPPIPFEPQLRVLLITSRPEGTGFIDPRGIARELVDEVQSQIESGTIEVEFLRPPTLDALYMRLSDTERPIHVLHFDGHGTFSQQSGNAAQGMLVFEVDEGQPQWVEAEEIAQVLKEKGVRLVVLNACKSAMGATDNAFSSVAAQLIQVGMDAVVAMSTSVLVASAARYVEAFYRVLARGMPASTAHKRALKALHDDPRRHLNQHLQDEVGAPIELRDWWVPHFYQRHTLELHPTRRVDESSERQLAPRLNRLGGNIAAAPAMVLVDGHTNYVCWNAG